MTNKVAFIAGATSFTGRALARQDSARAGVELKLQVRPRSPSRAKLGDDSRIVEVDLADPVALEDALFGVDCIVQLIGTVRARFDEAGSYEEVDYGTTRKLLDAARQRGVAHFLLVSSIGAGLGVGQYLGWKKKTEALVRESVVPWTIVRPATLAGDDDFPERPRLAATSAFLRGLSDTAFGAGLADLRPINIQLLARVLLHLVAEGASRRVVKGRQLWRIAYEHRLYDYVR